MKTCEKCKFAKPFESFFLDRRKPDQRSTLCITCRSSKNCKRCGQEKSLSEFHNDRKSSDGKLGVCKDCKKIEQRASYAKHRERRLGAVMTHYRRIRLKKDYGISEEQYLEMISIQNGKCAVCERHFSELAKSLAVDHCHTTGRVRGLLCFKCNAALGLLNDSPKNIQNLARYIEHGNVSDHNLHFTDTSCACSVA